VHVVGVVFAAGWAAFGVYWLIAALFSKHGRVSWSTQLRIRGVVLVAAVVLLRLGAFRHYEANTHAWRAFLGLVLFGCGLAFAVWGRLYLGSNWGLPMTHNDHPELVTDGPYRFVRHPIYSGILLAGIGTAIALSWMWLSAFALIGIYFGYSALIEERALVETFPDAYPAYQHSSKMLVPFIY
jgi:protein-S-isoprenylcysteine O-methyltransferase Ste14